MIRSSTSDTHFTTKTTIAPPTATTAVASATLATNLSHIVLGRSG